MLMTRSRAKAADAGIRVPLMHAAPCRLIARAGEERRYSSFERRLLDESILPGSVSGTQQSCCFYMWVVDRR